MDSVIKENHGKQTIRSIASRYMVALFALMIAITGGCQVDPEPAAATPTPAQTATETQPPSPATAPAEQATATEEQVLTTPTLAPTATPGQLDFIVGDIVQRTGTDNLTILGVSGADLVNLLISAFIVLLGSLIGVILVNGLVKLTGITTPQFDDRLMEALEKPFKWLIVLILLQFSTARLSFLSPAFKQWVNLAYFSLFAIVFGAMAWRLVDFTLEGSLKRASSPQQRDLLVAFTPLLRRAIQVVIIFTTLAIILQNLGVNLSALLAILGLGGLAISLAAKETLEDMISGFIVLIDRPFQVGDRIKIETMDSWGDVEAIGARTTRIRTLDNRLVIVPNSIIGKNQVENYSYPDPSYRIDVSLGIGYDSDIDHVIKTIEQAILSVDEIMKNPAPIVALVEFGDSAMIFRAMYWLKSYQDIQRRTDVNKAIYQALKEEKIDMPYITYDVNLVYKAEDGDN